MCSRIHCHIIMCAPHLDNLDIVSRAFPVDGKHNISSPWQPINYLLLRYLGSKCCHSIFSFIMSALRNVAALCSAGAERTHSQL